MLCFPLPEIQVVIVTSTPAKPTPPVSPLDISFPATPVNPIILSHRLRYYRDRYPRLLYQRLS
jgi:hypothetical protein